VKALIHDIYQDKYTLKTTMKEMHMLIVHAQCLTIVSHQRRNYIW